MRRFFQASALLSTVLFSAAAVASSPATGADTSTRTQPAGSVMTPAQILYAPKADFTQVWGDVPHDAEVVLKLNVNEEGKAQGIKVVKSEDPALDGPVIDAVSKYKFRPARVDNQPVAAAMNLVIKVHE